jgi:CBS domain containing-hemolysin-like protein
LRDLFGLGAASIRDDIEDALDDTTTAAEFSPQEQLILRNVLGLHDLRIIDVMVPRADIVAVPDDMSLLDVLAIFRAAGHSRLPVHGDTLDDPRGMIHIRDFVDHLAASAERAAGQPVAVIHNSNDALAHMAGSAGIDLSRTLNSAGIVRPVLFAPPSMRAVDLLVRMQASRTHMALVIDEHGGTSGLVSMEDIVEMIVGDIEDEHDVDETPPVDQLADGSVVADARAEPAQVAALAGMEALLSLVEDETIQTLGGLVTALAGHVPVRGEIVRTIVGLEFEIQDSDPRRVKKIRILRSAALDNNAQDKAL